MKKRSISIRGHATSISLEAPFWHALQQLAHERGMSIASVVAEIDANRQSGLSSAIRVYILETLQERMTLPSEAGSRQD